MPQANASVNLTTTAELPIEIVELSDFPFTGSPPGKEFFVYLIAKILAIKRTQEAISLHNKDFSFDTGVEAPAELFVVP
jgi:hypothetical protein